VSIIVLREKRVVVWCACFKRCSCFSERGEYRETFCCPGNRRLGRERRHLYSHKSQSTNGHDSKFSLLVIPDNIHCWRKHFRLVKYARVQKTPLTAKPPCANNPVLLHPNANPSGPLMQLRSVIIPQTIIEQGSRKVGQVFALVRGLSFSQTPE
jgi:hypothetical protein